MPPEGGRLPRVARPSWACGSTVARDRRAGRCAASFTRVNRQPAVACYVAAGDGAWRPFAIDVLRIAGGEIAEIVAFTVEEPARYGLPEVLA